MTAILFVAAHLAALLILVATAWVGGRLLLRAAATAGLTVSLRSAAEEVVLATTLGLVGLAHLGLLLAFAGRLAVSPLLVVVALVHALGWRTWRSEIARQSSWWRGLTPGRGWITLALGLLVLAPLFTQALYPPVAFDETMYHLPFVRAFAESGGVSFQAELRFPVFPQFAEVLSALMLLLAGDAATHLVALVANLLTAAVLWMWGRESFGAPVGWLAAAVWLGNPIVIYLGGTGYVEPLLALMVTAAWWAWSRWRNSASVGWLVLSAVFVAAAADIKYLGLFFVVLLAVATLLGSPGGSHAVAVFRGWRPAFVFACAAGCVLLPWYGRLVAETGNPVFPFLSGVFGGSAWTVAGVSSLFARVDPQAGLGDALGGYLGILASLPWDVVMRRHLVGGLPPFSPVYLVAAPILVAAAFADRRIRSLLLPSVAFALVFPLLPPDSRFLVTVLPLVSLAVAATLAAALHWLTTRLEGSQLSGAVRVLPLVVLAFLPGWLYAGYRLLRQGSPPTNAVSREAYLHRALPMYPALARFVAERSAGEKVFALFCEELQGLAPGAVIGDVFGPDRFSHFTPRFDDPPVLAAMLRRTGAVYLLLDKHGPQQPATGLASWPEHFLLRYEDANAALYRIHEPGRAMTSPVAVGSTAREATQLAVPLR